MKLRASMRSAPPPRQVFAALLVGAAASSFAGATSAASAAQALGAVSKAALVSRAAEGQRSGIAWPMARFTYRAEGKRVAEVLQDFAASQGLPLVLAEGVEGVAHGNFDTQPEEFLDAISKAYGLLWYHDGTALYVYPAQAVQSRMFRLKGVRRQQVTELLDSLHLGDRRYPLRFDARAQALFVYGPPRHVELVAAAVEQLDANVSDRNRRTVRVVPLRFASAGDRTMGQTRIPGLAAILTDLYASGASPHLAEDTGAAAAYPASGKARPLPGLLGSERTLADILTRRSGEPGGSAAAAYGAGKSAAVSPARAARGGLDDDEAPIFRADEGTNSILVFGRPQRLAEYADLIKRLDLKPVLVELEATIIDVSADSVDALGITWQLQGARGNLSVTPPATVAAPFQITTLWANAGRELLARVDALTARGKASIVARPKVLGVANRPAVMKDKRVLAVKVSGSLEANLYQLEAGTLLQMTPYVIPGDGESRIRLSLYIEDGNFEETTVDGIPVLKRMEISTEAHVLDGESLLIGGITTSVDASQMNGVPGLSKLPFLGALFRTTSDKRLRSERMFLITPRVIRDIAGLPVPPLPGALLPAPEIPTAPVPRVTE